MQGLRGAVPGPAGSPLYVSVPTQGLHSAILPVCPPLSVLSDKYPVCVPTRGLHGEFLVQLTHH